MRGIILAAVFCMVLPCVYAYKKRVLQELFELSNTCKKLYLNVDEYDEVEIKSMERRAAPHSASLGSKCMAYFKTSNPGQGLCIRMQGVLITSEHVNLEIWTGPYAPERIFRLNSPWRGNWCFPHGFLVMKVSTSSHEDNVDRAVMYSFAVTNVSMDTVPRQYFMDSFIQCGLSHKLDAGQQVTVEAERDPKVTPDLSRSCELSFESTSQDEHEQLCLEMTVLPPRDDKGDIKPTMPAAKALRIEGLDLRFYNTGQAVGGAIACSENKRLKLSLTRNATHSFNFRATVTSQWHPNWEKVETEASELTALNVVKGITYFIATIDCLVAILGAGLAFILKRPTGPWRRWAEEFNAQSAAHAPQPYPPQDPGSYGSMHTCKDGNYPELPLEGATPTTEVLVETHTY